MSHNVGREVQKDIESVLYTDIIKRQRKTPFLIFVSFVIVFLLARATVLYGPETWRLLIRSYHIHHFYYGFAFMTVAGWISLTTDRTHMFRFAAVLFGAGLGLFLDEFGLLLTCTTPAVECDYFARQSYDIFVVTVAVFLAILYFKPMMRGVRKFFSGFIRA